MSNYNPASILFDQNGNPVGVILDSDGNYRLQVQSIVTNKSGQEASIDTKGTRVMLATNSITANLLLEKCVKELTKIRKHLASITEEEWDDTDDED